MKLRNAIVAVIATSGLALSGLVGTSPATAAESPGTPFSAPPAASTKNRQPKPVKLAKQKPPADFQTRTACGTPCYSYAGARWTGTAVQGAVDNMLVYTPIKQASDYHTLAEIAVQSSDSQQAVEAGWTVDPTLNGDSNPHLFVYSWKNGTGQGYNGGNGWTDNGSESINAGDSLATYNNTKIKFLWQSFDNKWWLDAQISGADHWIGYYPHSSWTSPTFTTSPRIQVFGEVSAANTPTCTDMGNGTQAGVGAGAQNGSFTTYDGSTWALTSITGTNFNDSANGYDFYSESNYTFRYGGGGSPQAVGC